MSEHYEFPDAEDVPQIVTTTDEPYEQPEKKTLFIKYREDEWEDEETATRVIETINWLFGTDVQIAVVPEAIEFLLQEDVEEMLREVSDGDT